MIRERIPTPLQVGPEDPIEVLPPALFSRSLEAVENIVERMRALGAPKLTWASCAAFVHLLDVNRNLFGRALDGAIEVVRTFRDGKSRLATRIYDEYLLEMDQDIEDRPITQWMLVKTAHYPGEILRPNHDAHLQSWWGLVIDECTRVSDNSPYLANPFGSIEHKWRTKVVKLLSSPESTESVLSFAVETAKRARLLFLPGWCGGIALHPVSRLNNTRQLAILIEAIRDHHLQEKFDFSPSDLLNWRNCDGCTPLYIAYFFGAQEAAQILIQAGAKNDIPDRFNRLPKAIRPMPE